MRDWRSLLGIEFSSVSHAEKWISFLGALCAVTAVFYISMRHDACIRMKNENVM